jgi:trigger factor
MSSKLESIDKNKVKLTIEVTPEKFEEAVQKSYLKKRKDITIDGFRPGKAPRKVLETQFGDGVFFEDAIDFAFPDAYRAAIDEHVLFPVSNPDLGIEKIGKEEGLVFTAEFWVKPEVKLGAYKGIKAKKVVAKVSAKEVDAEIEKTAEQSIRWIEVQREAIDGDRVTIDFSGSIDGEKFDGGTAEGYTLDLGSNSFIEGFEPQLVGMKIGEDKDVKVKFPEEYQAENLSGKDAIFTCKLHKIEEKELPKIDDDFAQDVSEFETLAEFKADVKSKLLETAKNNAKSETENNVISAVVEKSKMDIPECMVESQIDYHIKRFEYQLMYQGMKMDDYLQYTGTKIEDIKEQYKEQSQKTVETQLVLEAVMKAEDIKATDKEINAELKKTADSMKKTLEEYKTSAPANTIENIETKITFDKVIDFMMDSAELS